jgi:hypothetical protein
MATERRCKPAALSALSAAVPLGMGGTAVYFVLVRGRGLLEKLTLREYLTSAMVVFILWLILWALIAARRRRLGPPDLGPVEEPPRPVSELTGRELAEWARGDPEKLRRLMRRRRC